MRARPVVRAVFGVLLVLWILVPLVPLALWSVADRWQAPAVLPNAYSLDAFAVLGAPGTLSAAASSLLLGSAVAIIATPLGLMGALAARALPGRYGRAVDLILLLPLAVPPFALVMGANITLLRLYVPPFAGVVLLLVVIALPYTAFMFRSALATYEQRFEDVALTLGADPRQVLRHVRMPLLSAATVRAFFLAFLVGWGDYITTLLVGGGQLTTLPMLLGSAASSTGNEQLVAVLSLAVIVPPAFILAAVTLPAVITTRAAALTRKAHP
ncbi:ABC transporter permease [Arthrobacter sp. B1805]|uniref:ABC transporter permease n=1 Tax=Arthrobacter sp. B1805 TaxID=2058892 RepID=UPI001CA4A48F|nr:ABC transporter permease subunit [Arthrobacter sp. B1805]